MATVYITEYSGLGPGAVGSSYISVPFAPPLTNQTVAIGGSSTQSSAFGTSTHLIRVHSDAVCSIAIGGSSPTATAALARFAANQTEYFSVLPGDKLAVITNT